MTLARRFGGPSFVAGCALSSIASAVPAEQPPGVAPRAAPVREESALELTATLGPSIVFGEPANPQYAQSFNRLGAFGELGVAYRSNYFIDPYLAVGYAALASGESVLPAGPWGQGGTLDQHLGVWLITPGITTDIWRFRPRLGLGVAIIVQRFGYLGNETMSTQLPIATELGLGFNAYHDDWVRLDVEARVVLARGADVTFTTLTAALRADFAHFTSR